MKRIAGLTILLMASSTLGCVERRFIVVSNPPGALVYQDGICLGNAPADGSFVYYGKHHFRLIKAGYETLDVVQPFPVPWYEFPGIDFVAENLWPFKLRDVKKFEYVMQPMSTIPPDDVRQQAEMLRARGLMIGPPRVPPTAPAPLPPTVTPNGPTSPPPEGTLPSPRPIQ